MDRLMQEGTAPHMHSLIAQRLQCLEECLSSQVIAYEQIASDGGGDDAKLQLERMGALRTRVASHAAAHSTAAPLIINEPEAPDKCEEAPHQSNCSICLHRVGTDGDQRAPPERRIAELQCGHRFGVGCLKEQLRSRERRCGICRAKCASAAQRSCSQQEAAHMRAARRTALLTADGSARYETLMYDVGCESEDESPPPAHRLHTTGDDWRDVAGDALTTKQALQQRCHAQCSLATIRNLYRDQSFSPEELAASCVDADYKGDIRFPDSPKLMQGLLREGELVKAFNPSLVAAQLFSRVRLAACILTHRTHVIAVVCDGAREAFRLYDNDASYRQRGTFESRSVQGMCMNATWYAVMAADSPLSQRLGGEGLTTAVMRCTHRRSQARQEPTLFDV
mmetsp:Transcript_49914/g.106682  ORF Transcript_49914/g.106682 Transcript_49914/m.106682 type:complete len:395 (-) Transcript_49914:240-1424(-)